MNLIVFAIPIFLTTTLLEAWLAHRRGLAAYSIPDAISSYQYGLLSQVVGAFTKLAKLGVYTLVFEAYRATTLPSDSLWVWVGALVAYDFFYYWHHRMNHEIGLLWAGHVSHHSSEYFNLATAIRQSSTSALLGWIFYLPMAVAGVPPSVFAWVLLIDLLYQYWVHTEVIGRLGWLDRIFVTPSNHRVHHGQNDYCMDTNYGGILILWDRLFGTFAEERKDEKVIYGVRTPLQSLNPFWGNMHYYIELWQKSKATPGWRAKLGVWLAPPGGWHDEASEPYEPSQFKYYDPCTPDAVKRYAVVHQVLAMLFLMHFLTLLNTLPKTLLALYAAGFAISAISLTSLLEGRANARRFEQCRVIGLGIAFAALPDWFGFSMPIALKLMLLVVMLGSAAWLSRTSFKPAALWTSQ